MEKSSLKAPSFKTWLFCSNLQNNNKTLKTFEGFGEKHENHQSQREKVFGSPLAASGGENTLLSPTFGPLIGGWADHLRQPNVNPKPCNVRRPNLCISPLLLFLSQLISFTTWKHSKLLKTPENICLTLLEGSDTQDSPGLQKGRCRTQAGYYKHFLLGACCISRRYWGRPQEDRSCS